MPLAVLLLSHSFLWKKIAASIAGLEKANHNNGGTHLFTTLLGLDLYRKKALGVCNHGKTPYFVNLVIWQSTTITQKKLLTVQYLLENRGHKVESISNYTGL